MCPGSLPRELDRLGGLGFIAAQALSPPDLLHHQPAGRSPASDRHRDPLPDGGPGCSGGHLSVVSPGQAASEAGESALLLARELPPGLCQQPLRSLTGSLIAEPRQALAMFLA